MPTLYVPILKGKEGEFAALEALSPEIKVLVKPLIEIPAVPFNFAAGRDAKTLDEHIRNLPERLFRSWGESRFYLETPFFGEEEQLEGDRCAFEVLLNNCLERGLNPTPVVSTSSSDACLAAIRDRAAGESGACVRLSMNDFAEEVEPADEVDAILGGIGKESAAGLDLLIDFGDLTTENATSLLLARSILSMIPRRDEWRSLIFAAASFPEDLSGVTSSSAVTIPRREWLLWQALQRKPTLLPPNLIFGDYAISHPLVRGLDPRIMRMSASIRYTIRESWLIVKGRNVNQYGFEQYFNLCRQLVERPEYFGETFSWGDQFIWNCAQGTSGPGNATTWRKVGVNHHITLVAKQLSNPF
jgi:hypothetical protein